MPDMEFLSNNFLKYLMSKKPPSQPPPKNKGETQKTNPLPEAHKCPLQRFWR